jgi:hypothetical protein
MGLRWIVGRAWGVVGIAGLLVLAATPAEASGANRAPFELNRRNSCASGEGIPRPTGFGFAIVHLVGERLTTNVVLRGAEPNHTYGVFVTQTPSGAGCNVEDATITTNPQGNGTLRLSERALRSTTGAFVLVWDQDFRGPWFQTARILVE